MAARKMRRQDEAAIKEALNGGAKRRRAFSLSGRFALAHTLKAADGEPEQQIVFGWFSVVEANGKAVVDKEGDVIPPEEIERAGYRFVLHARLASDSHQRIGVGHLIESCVFTAEKQAVMVQSLKALGINATIDLGAVAWWGGFKVDDPEVWAAIKSGEYAAFSIGGVGMREEMAAD